MPRCRRSGRLLPGSFGSWPAGVVAAAQQVRVRGRAARRSKAVASCFAQGQCSAMRRRARLADLVMRAETCSSPVSRPGRICTPLRRVRGRPQCPGDRFPRPRRRGAKPLLSGVHEVRLLCIIGHSSVPRIHCQDHRIRTAGGFRGYVAARVADLSRSTSGKLPSVGALREAILLDRFRVRNRLQLR